MGDFCICLEHLLIMKGTNIVSSVLELLFLSIIILIGVVVNSIYRTKLFQEKKNMPIGRKGNVIEPVMSLFCVLQIMYWPYTLINSWLTRNGIVYSESMPLWLCYVRSLVQKAGRICLGYNSLFVALIRYIHIVHLETSNQWNYENVARRFKMASIGFPIAMEVWGYFFHGYSQFKDIPQIRDCLATSPDANISEAHLETWIPSGSARWTRNYLPDYIVDAMSYTYVAVSIAGSMNIIEAFLYLAIFRNMKRYGNGFFLVLISTYILSRKKYKKKSKNTITT